MFEGCLRGFMVGALICSASVCGPAATADSADARFAVRARVASTATLEQRDVPEFVDVTSAQRDAGQVTVRATLTVRTNDSEGYLISMWPTAAWFESVTVAGLASPALLDAEGGAIVRRTGGPTRETVALEFTFELREGLALPAALAWPLELQVTPL